MGPRVGIGTTERPPERTLSGRECAESREGSHQRGSDPQTPPDPGSPGAGELLPAGREQDRETQERHHQELDPVADRRQARQRLEPLADPGHTDEQG